ncbi:hypothetical protein BDF19DRAFT_144022 [Syncephalis fuscata]|nr:hypothetical protein BDF19DRAFT_144022 [Syncephalis fuscata]
MATRSVGIIIYDVVGDKGQILRDNPCFVIAWRSSCDYGRDLRFVANILQEKDTGYDGRSGLFSLPNLHSILFQQNTYDMKKTTQEKSNWFNEWTGLMNAGGVYTTSLDVSLLQCGKLVANVVFSNAIVNRQNKSQSWNLVGYLHRFRTPLVIQDLIQLP